MVSEITSPISTPIIAAPFSITDLFTPAAKRASFHFFFTEDASMSRTLREGRIRAEAFTRPVSSSMVYRTFSMRCTCSTSEQIPPPVAHHGADIVLGKAGLAQDLGAPLAVLLGKLLVVDVVDQPDDAPFLLVLAELARVVAHDGLDGKRMAAETLGGVVLQEEGERLFPCWNVRFDWHERNVAGPAPGGKPGGSRWGAPAAQARCQGTPLPPRPTPRAWVGMRLHGKEMLSILERMNGRRADQLPGSFFELVRLSEMPVLVDFWAEWCGPCRTVSPAIERLAREYAGRVLTVKVNVDRKPNVAQAYEIQGIPTIMLFWRGEPRMRLTGAYPYEAILQNLLENWPSEAGLTAEGAQPG